MSCDDVRPRLTGYLDGELEGDRGSVIRGHLRECAACRSVAVHEAALRDELRRLPPIDPPASLWAGVQARLAEAEVADARRPAWRRALARWVPLASRYALGALPPGYRAILVLHDVEGLSHEECAAILECRVGTCKSQLHKARARMRELLGPHLDRERT